MKSLDAFIREENMFSVINSGNTQFAPVFKTRCDLEDRSNLGYHSELRIEFDHRNKQQALEEIPTLFHTKEVTLEDESLLFLKKLLNIGSNVAITLCLTDDRSLIRGILHLNASMPDYIPNRSTHKFEPLWKLLFSKAETCVAALQGLCDEYRDYLNRQATELEEAQKLYQPQIDGLKAMANQF
jgi:hypothetical protein